MRPDNEGESMKMLGYIAAAVAGLFVLMLIIGANGSDEQAAQWAN